MSEKRVPEIIEELLSQESIEKAREKLQAILDAHDREVGALMLEIQQYEEISLAKKKEVE